VTLKIENRAAFRLQIDLPPHAHTTVVLPRRQQNQVLLDDKPIDPAAAQLSLTVDVPPGRHVLESR